MQHLVAASWEKGNRRTKPFGGCRVELKAAMGQKATRRGIGSLVRGLSG